MKNSAPVMAFIPAWMWSKGQAAFSSVVFSPFDLNISTVSTVDSGASSHMMH